MTTTQKNAVNDSIEANKNLVKPHEFDILLLGGMTQPEYKPGKISNYFLIANYFEITLAYTIYI